MNLHYFRCYESRNFLIETTQSYVSVRATNDTSIPCQSIQTGYLYLGRFSSCRWSEFI